ncbi:AMP-binding protein [Microbulbifer sp. SAOS-129_SWC]|uniref:class I adenylate-forming enzyme family protein n=1 Tax=Microbulbifer sp. SAOS-129_SWC TaxID=3145235 RepID=UPI0032171F6F
MIHIDASSSNVDLLIDRHVRAGRGDHPALVECSPAGRRSLTYRELQRATLAAAQELHVHLAGSRYQRHVALVGGATLENTVYWLGAMRAGHLPFMVHPALPREHYEALWEDFDPELVLADNCTDIDQVEGAEPMTAITELVTGASASAEPAEASALAASLDLRPALVLATSGSTGRPKLCVHSHRAFWEFERTVTRPLWGIRADDRVLASTGPYFSFGLQGLHVPLSQGATAIMLPRWQRHADFLDVIETEAVSVFLAVPTLYHLLLTRAPRDYRLDKLRLSLSAGERLPPVIRRRWEAWSGARMLNSIGTTETFAPYLSETADGPRALQQVEGFHYTEMARDSDGPFSLSLSGGCLMLGYLQPDTDCLREPLPTRFDTNDLFVRDEEGLHFISRDSERIKVAGHWVSPQELEEFLLADKRVEKAAALAIETPEGLTRLRAYVVAETGGYSATALIDDLMKRIRNELHPRALRPDRIELVEDIATTPSGKLKRQELRSMVDGPVAKAGAMLAS